MLATPVRSEQLFRSHAELLQESLGNVFDPRCRRFARDVSGPGPTAAVEGVALEGVVARSLSKLARRSRHPRSQVWGADSSDLSCEVKHRVCLTSGTEQFGALPLGVEA